MSKNHILPGPFDPPDRSLPRRNITALSYSWTTFNARHYKVDLSLTAHETKIWCLKPGSFTPLNIV